MKLNILKIYIICIILISNVLCVDLYASGDDGHPIAELIAKLRQDERGPYKDIRWFCEDGTVIEPKSSCPGKGNQHARLKDEIANLATRKHLFLTQILTGTDPLDFYDKEHANSRMIQYQLEQYLFDVDQGWVNEKGQYYRGAKQVEDEMEWGRDFFIKILENKQEIRDNYLLLRRAARDIPHGLDDDNTRSVRALSLIISDLYPKFQKIRIKIHGLPQESDISLVKNFKANEKYPINVEEKLDELLIAMKALYERPDTLILKEYLKSIPVKNILDQELKTYIHILGKNPSPKYLVERSADLMELIRVEIVNMPKAKGRLDMLDLTNKLEDIILLESNKWEPKTINEALDKLCILNTAVKGGGYINEWEWLMMFEYFPEGEISVAMLDYLMDTYRKSIQWGTGMVYVNYKDVVGRFIEFEPLASGFTDDVIRSSPLLSMGITLDKIHTYFASEIKLDNKIFDFKNQSQVKGINPGYAKGILHVIDDFEDNPTLDPSKIYVFNQPPKELKPLAGIATVTEGNVVSHVQLLARNLGIPNAALSLETLNALKKYEGKEVFYAVSNKGTVVLKLAKDMNDKEKELFKSTNGNRTKIAIDLSKLQLGNTSILNIRQIDASSSGKLCGPKAANLAQLKNIFPDKVVEGIVIPFGIYRQHMDQKRPGINETYWQFINRVLYYLKDLEKQNLAQKELDNIQNKMLDSLKNAIVEIPLLPSFQSALQDSFMSVLGDRIGNVPVFLRSDTNMEDLKEFTGAGLNLTLFNVLDKEKIIKGIKEVWASPFSERSYKWRQKYLENPENIYPSILVIPSVDVDKSGVLITKGIANNNDDDLTIAFSQGVGGAVDGQSAETYIVHTNNNYSLMSPSRENVYKSIPASGGTVSSKKVAGRSTLTKEDLEKITKMSDEIKNAMPKFGMEGPYDVELGLKDGKIWLFQIRPFVENKSANSSLYLESISPVIPYQKLLSIESEL